VTLPWVTVTTVSHYFSVRGMDVKGRTHLVRRCLDAVLVRVSVYPYDSLYLEQLNPAVFLHLASQYSPGHYWLLVDCGQRVYSRKAGEP
jgi:hypothetical protein